MSLSLYVSCRKTDLPSWSKWQESISAAGFDLALNQFDWRSHSGGFLPAKFRGRASGFELMLEDAKPVARQLGLKLPAGHDVAVSFTVGTDDEEMAAATCASAALAQCTGGVYFDEFSDELLDGLTAVKVAQDSARAD